VADIVSFVDHSIFEEQHTVSVLLTERTVGMIQRAEGRLERNLGIYS
jgi:hypothetical protein